MNSSIPARRSSGDGLVVAPAEKASLLGSQFDGKQCCEQFIPHLSCFPQSRCYSFAIRTPFLLHLLLDFDTYDGVDSLGVFPLFLKNGQYAYSDNSTLLEVVRKLADRPAVATSLNKDLASIQEWCNHWCMIVNPNKTKALVVNRSRTVNPS